MSEADDLLASRQAVYGDRATQMRRTALVWEGLTGFPFKPWMIPMLMSSYKMIRAFETPDYSDNVDDVDGWMVMFREQMEADGTPIIQARTVEEYLAAKAQLQAEEKFEAVVNPHGTVVSPNEIDAMKAWDGRRAAAQQATKLRQQDDGVYYDENR